jgi:GNAT superfamily N-acetyltransferase
MVHGAEYRVSYYLSLLDAASIMKGIVLSLLIFLVSVYHLEAFLATKGGQSVSSLRPSTDRVYVRDDRSCLYFSELEATKGGTNELSHAEIVWKIRPQKQTSIFKKVFMRLAANLIRLDCFLKRTAPPILLCPKGGQAVLEAYRRLPENPRKLQKMGRFGITTESGSPIPPIQETVSDLYGLDPNISVRTAAIIYMFVEPEHRQTQVGKLALEAISLVHSVQGCDFTVLVADDNGSGKLVEWYERHGFMKAPKLQDVFGSPDGKYGITMIRPTQSVLPNNCTIQWW